eukprot:Awhi_evm1s1985
MFIENGTVSQSIDLALMGKFCLFTVDIGTRKDSFAHGRYKFALTDKNNDIQYQSQSKAIGISEYAGIWRSVREHFYVLSNSTPPYTFTIMKSGAGQLHLDNANIFCKNGPGEWAAWSDFSNCSSQCSGGLKTRTRNCLDDVNNCPGFDTEQQNCNMHLCELENVVLNKPCIGSTTGCEGLIDDILDGFEVLDKASDGPLSGLYGLIVDLGKNYSMSSFELHSRSADSCCFEGLRNYTIEVLDISNETVGISNDNSWIPGAGTIKFDSLSGVGRYIKLWTNGYYNNADGNVLEFKQMRVFGREIPDNATIIPITETSDSSSNQSQSATPTATAEVIPEATVTNVVTNKPILCSGGSCFQATDNEESVDFTRMEKGTSGQFENLFGLLVDLEEKYSIQSFEFKARTNFACCFEGLRNFTIELLDESYDVVASANDPTWIPSAGTNHRNNNSYNIDNNSNSNSNSNSTSNNNNRTITNSYN